MHVFLGLKVIVVLLCPRQKTTAVHKSQHMRKIFRRKNAFRISKALHNPLLLSKRDSVLPFCLKRWV